MEVSGDRSWWFAAFELLEDDELRGVAEPQRVVPAHSSSLLECRRRLEGRKLWPVEKCQARGVTGSGTLLGVPLGNGRWRGLLADFAADDIVPPRQPLHCGVRPERNGEVFGMVRDLSDQARRIGRVWRNGELAGVPDEQGPVNQCGATVDTGSPRLPADHLHVRHLQVDVPGGADDQWSTPTSHLGSPYVGGADPVVGVRPPEEGRRAVTGPRPAIRVANQDR